jgi:adenylate cyclase
MHELADIDNKKNIIIPIWLQLAVTMTLIIVGIVLTFSFSILNRQREQLYDQTVKIGMVSLNYFAKSAPIPLLEDNILSLNNLLKESTSVEGILYAFILNSEGIIQAHSNLNEIGKIHEPILRKQNLTQENGITHFSYHLPSGKNVLNLIRSVEYRDKSLGEVHVGLSIDFIEDVIWREKKRILEWSLIILFVGIVIAIILGIYFSIPISKLVVATREISQGNFKQKVKIRRKDELGNLARAFNHMSDELWVKSLMKKSFGKYVGHEILELILKSPESKWLEGQKNEATVIFADIRGFTSYSERTMPDKVIMDLNEFFEIATNIILNHKGYVDKFIGDAVLGVFGVPVYHSDHEETAVRACMEMQKTFKEKVQEKKKKNNESNQLLISVGISINSGLVVSGNIGSQEKMEYTVIGDAVNLASRINGFAGAGEVIIGEAIFEKLADRIDTIAMPPAVIKGKSELVRTYKVLRFYEK